MNIHEKRAWRILVELGAREIELGGKKALHLSPIRVTSKDKCCLFVQAVLNVVGRSGANRRHVDRRGCPVYIVTNYYTAGQTSPDRHEPETTALLARLRKRKEPAMSELIIQTQEDLRFVLSQISFAPSCVAMGWQWQIEELWLADGQLRGWLINTTFRRPDTPSGEVGTGKGRKELVTRGATESAVVKTCWLLAELIVRHELMEAFLYQGVRIFDPPVTARKKNTAP